MQKIESGADKGQDLRHVLDQLALEQKILIEEEQAEEEELKNLREIKDMRETEAREYSQKLRMVK